MGTEDAELRGLLQRLDREVPLHPDAERRVLERAIAALDDEAGVGRRVGTSRGRSIWIGRAAAAVIVLAGFASLVLLAQGGGSEPAPATEPIEAATTTVAPDGRRALEPLGFRSFTSYRFVNVGAGGLIDSSIDYRVAGVEPAGDASTTASLRRSLIGLGADVDGTGVPQIDQIDLVGQSGRVGVPIEFLDPDGACTGGSISVGVDGADVIDPTVRCGDRTTDVRVESTTGPIETLDLAGERVDARPVELRLDPGGDIRLVTLWFSDDGLVRHTVPIGTTPTDHDLTADGLAELGP